MIKIITQVKEKTQSVDYNPICDIVPIFDAELRLERKTNTWLKQNNVTPHDVTITEGVGKCEMRNRYSVKELRATIIY